MTTFVILKFTHYVSGRLFLLGEKNKSVELEDVKFHQCVRLSRFENDRTISFIPPDGESELMSYRLNTTVSMPTSFPIRITVMWKNLLFTSLFVIIISCKQKTLY